MSDVPECGRVFFSHVRRSLEQEDEIELTSVGVDIGSSTSHLVFSKLLMERLDNRYIVSERTVLHESAVLLTPYAADQSIDAQALKVFIDAQYARAGLQPDDIDSGALILTGVAVRRNNSRAIADLFASQAGKFVSVSAGDALETTLAAFGSGAAARSIRETARVMNIDIGGGTTKIAVCEGGELVDLTAIDIGARLLALDDASRLVRMEEAGRYFLQQAGLDVAMGQPLTDADLQVVTDLMASKILEACGQGVMSTDTAKLLRLPELKHRGLPDVLTFSGGVSEYIYGREVQAYGDLGPHLAKAVLAKAQAWGAKIVQPEQGIRATVIGASQYTVQISGSTIYVEPSGQLPVRNVPVIAPVLDLQAEALDVQAIAQAIRDALIRIDMHQGEQAVGLCYQWQGSATFARLDAFCRALGLGLQAITEQGHALLLVGDADCGGLIGIHCHEELHMTCPVISIDGIHLKALDFIDVGAMLETSGAVPVVIKSLVFPATAALGQVHKV
ncbi:ethanolamine ammonia-lyase reactivating factor EutA [Limnohabitans sp. Rim8]|uniref:ethanolamine ammonia-lyase reactivating factor EutA n=1 Tax=Limnohabitans sp. Rim8 TaxID=1100718 RepID=UPI0025F43A78|nr:ethanolamine ammonia-lyase reactivating factor EutA [Limnohabitans sp. Rim8]